MSDIASQVIANGLLSNIPTLLVGIVGGIVVLTKRNQAPHATVWAILGLALLVALSVIFPIVNGFIQDWVFQNRGQGMASRSWVLSVVGVGHSALRALSYVFLLVAIYSGRTSPWNQSAAHPPTFG